MAQTINITRVDHRPDGTIEIFDDTGVSREFPDLATLKGYTDQQDQDWLWRVVVAHWLAKSPDGSNDNLLEGKSFTFDPTQNLAIIQVS